MIRKILSLLGVDQAFAETVVVTNDDHHNAIYKRGSGWIAPHMQLLGRNPKPTKRVRGEVTRGIRDLDAVTAYNPKNWAAFWIKGKGYQVLGDQASANFEFKSSFFIQKDNADVAREYAASCLELGLGDEAIGVLQHAIGLTPQDAGLHANLSLAYLIAGKKQEAKDAIEKSLKMSPDEISLAVKKIVDEVVAGERSLPKTMADLNQPDRKGSKS